MLGCKGPVIGLLAIFLVTGCNESQQRVTRRGELRVDRDQAPDGGASSLPGNGSAPQTNENGIENPDDGESLPSAQNELGFVCREHVGSFAEELPLGLCDISVETPDLLNFKITGCDEAHLALDFSEQLQLSGQVPATACEAELEAEYQGTIVRQLFRVRPHVDLTWSEAIRFDAQCRLQLNGNAIFNQAEFLAATADITQVIPAGEIAADEQGLSIDFGSIDYEGQFHVTWSVNSTNSSSTTTLERQLQIVKGVAVSGQLATAVARLDLGLDAAEGREASRAGCDLSCAQSVPGQIAMGANHACALRPDGLVACWGQNECGQLGNGTSGDCDLEAADAIVNTPVAVLDGSGAFELFSVVQLAAGRQHTCALLTNGSVRCWGRGLGGELGDGLLSNSPLAVEIVDADGNAVTNVSALTAGDQHTCALTQSGSVLCWGDNSASQIAEAGPAVFAAAQTVNLGEAVKNIAAGAQHTCALTMNGEVICWGDNSWAQSAPAGVCPEGSATAVAPAKVANLTAVVMLQAGGRQTCAQTTEGEILCWGRNLDTQLGPTVAECAAAVPSPRALPTGELVVASLALGDRHSCLVTVDRQVACLGWNQRGQVGQGAGGRYDLPTVVPQLQAPVAVAGGDAHSCALDVTAEQVPEVRCWGEGQFGQLGNGANDLRALPALVQGQNWLIQGQCTATTIEIPVDKEP